MKILPVCISLIILFSGCIGQNENLVFSCGELTQSNTTYKLINDISVLEVAGLNLSNVCLSVKADNITVDCNGKRIFADTIPFKGRGILAENVSNVTIKNCEIEGFGTKGQVYRGSRESGTVSYGNGIRLESVDNCKIMNNETKKNSVGIVLFKTTNCEVTGNKLEDRLSFLESENASVSKNEGVLSLSASINNEIFNNNLIRLSFLRSNFNVVRNNNIQSNNTGYIRIGLNIIFSNDNQFLGNEIQYNSTGINLEGSYNNSFSNNEIKFNTAEGLTFEKQPGSFGGYSENNTFKDNIFCENTLDIDCPNSDQIDGGGNKWNGGITGDYKWNGPKSICGLTRVSTCSDDDIQNNS